MSEKLYHTVSVNATHTVLAPDDSIEKAENLFHLTENLSLNNKIN